MLGEKWVEAVAVRVVDRAEAGHLHVGLGCSCGPTLVERVCMAVVDRAGADLDVTGPWDDVDDDGNWRVP